MFRALKLWFCYVHRGRVIVPTVARADSGFHLEVNPVRIADITDVASVEAALLEALKAGNPVARTPPVGMAPKPVVLTAVNMNSWARFEKTALSFELKLHDNWYKIYRLKVASDRGLIESLPPLVEMPYSEPITRVASRWASSLVQQLPEMQ